MLRRKFSLETMIEERVEGSKDSLRHIREVLSIFREAESTSRDRSTTQRVALEAHSCTAMELLDKAQRQPDRRWAQVEQAGSGQAGSNSDQRTGDSEECLTTVPKPQHTFGRFYSLKR